MNVLEEKSKEILASTSKIQRLFHKNKRSKDFQHGIMMALKIIHNDYLSHKDNEKYHGIKTSDLTKKLCITKPATSKILNSLEEKGYIERSSNKEDRRIVYVKLTEKGTLYLQEQNIKFKKFTYKVIEKMGEEDIDNLIRLFNKLYNVIEEIQLEE